MPVSYNIDEVSEGMVLGEAVMLPSGKMLLNAGYNISEQYKNRLKELGYKTLLVAEPGTEGVLPSNIVSDRLTSEIGNSLEDIQKNVSSLMDKFRTQTKADIHQIIVQKRNDLNQFVMNASLTRQVEMMVNELFNENEVVLNLAALKNAGDSAFFDSINVAITSLCIAKKFN